MKDLDHRFVDRIKVIEELVVHKNRIKIKTSSGLFECIFDYDIFEYKLIDDKVIVRIDSLRSKNETRNRNVFCLDENAKILWQIQQHHAKRPFTRIELIEPGIVRAHNWSGDYWDLQLDAGEWIQSMWGIRPFSQMDGARAI